MGPGPGLVTFPIFFWRPELRLGLDDQGRKKFGRDSELKSPGLSKFQG